VTLPAAALVDDTRANRGPDFEALVRHSPGMVSVIAHDGTVLYASPSHERTLGYPPDDLTGLSALDLVHPDDRTLVGSAFASALGAEAAVHLGEFRFRHANGSWRVCEAEGRDLADDPAVAGVLVNTHDVTARSQCDAARIVDVRVSDALASVGRELMRTLAKPLLLDRLCTVAAEALRATASGAFLAESASAAFLPMASFGDTRRFAHLVDRADAVADLVRDRLTSEDVFEIGLPAEGDDPSGRSRWLCIALRGGAQLKGILVVGRSGDAPYAEAEHRIAAGVSQLASMALENARLLGELERANRVKSDFVATMSHELRTPLHIILGYLSLINEGDFGPLSESQQEALRLVDRSAHALLELVQDTLDLSRLEREGLPIHHREASLSDLLGTLERETRRFQRDEAAVAVSWHVEDAAPRLVTDTGKLKIVLRNLVHNALKFTPAGEVRVLARSRAGGFEFSVEDSGIGIASDDFSRIFEPFAQLGETSTRTHGGVGMGLYVARRLTELLGGTISVASRPGAGSTFTVWIPSSLSMTANGSAPASAAGAPS